MAVYRDVSEERLVPCGSDGGAMGLNTDIRQIAREVFREELGQLELALRTGVTPPTLAQVKAEPRAPAATPGTSQREAERAKARVDRRGNPGRRDIDREAQLRRSLAGDSDKGGELARWLTAEQVATHYGLTLKAVYSRASRGELPSLRLGRRSMRFDRQALDKLLRASARGYLVVRRVPSPGKETERW
jgi:excisionase family DNA binding protein